MILLENEILSRLRFPLDHHRMDDHLRNRRNENKRFVQECRQIHNHLCRLRSGKASHIQDKYAPYGKQYQKDLLAVNPIVRH